MPSQRTTKPKPIAVYWGCVGKLKLCHEELFSCQVLLAYGSPRDRQKTKARLALALVEMKEAIAKLEKLRPKPIPPDDQIN